MTRDAERRLLAVVTVAVFVIILGIVILPRDYIMLH